MISQGKWSGNVERVIALASEEVKGNQRVRCEGITRAEGGGHGDAQCKERMWERYEEGKRKALMCWGQCGGFGWVRMRGGSMSVVQVVCTGMESIVACDGRDQRAVK